MNVLSQETPDVEAILRKKRSDNHQGGFHMMATIAYHKMGEISSPTPDLCFIYSESGDFYVGNWVYEMGFFDVLFPKSTTQPLTASEVDRYTGSGVQIGSNVFPLNLRQRPPVLVARQRWWTQVLQAILPR